ncbi:MAG: carboxypeptidase-like regulatory domain-containing protein [Phocaeicola sp.]
MKTLFTLLLLGVTLQLQAQLFTGTVQEQGSNQPIEGVNVSLLSEEGFLLAYTLTDEKGLFTLEATSSIGTAKLHLSFMGYKSIRILTNEWVKDKKIEMEEETFKLKEVKVTAQRIVEKQDTLLYSVAGFAMPQDRSIADVIAKMPGMEVKANGQIAYNGRTINKFYIEGMDLMGNQYALASNNLSKKRVKSIEVIRNHQPVELLRGKSFSDQAALNLILDDNSKLNWVGAADLGVGANSNDFLYNNRLLAMLFKRKQQNLSIYKNDNTGVDLFREINPVSRRELNSNHEMEQPLISSVSILTPDIDLSRYNFNHSHLVATNHLSQLAEKATLRTQISLFTDVAKQRNYLENSYFFDEENSQTMSESNQLHNKRNRLDGTLNFEINRPTLYLNANFKTTLDWLSSQSQTLWDETQRNLQAQLDRKYLAGEFDLKLPLSNNRYLSLTNVTSYNEHPQQLTLYTNQLQRLDYSSFYSHTSSSFRHKAWGMYVNYHLGVKIAQQSLATDIEGSPTIARERFTNYQPYTAATISYQNEVVKTEGELKMSLLYYQLKKGEIQEEKSHYTPEARFLFHYALAATSSLNLRYSYKEEFPNLRGMYDGNLFVSYRSSVNNAHTPKLEPSHYLSLRYEYSHPIQALFVSLISAVSTTQKYTAYRTSLSSEAALLRRELVDANYHTTTFTLNGRISKAFGAWKSFVALDASYLAAKSAQFSSHALQPYWMDNYSVALSYAARPLHYLSFELKSAWQRSQVTLETTHTTDRLKHNLNLTLPLFAGFIVKMENSFYQSLDIKKESWFADLAATYTYKQVEFELKVNNLLGRESYEREFISSIEQNYYLYSLRPREYIAKVSFRF